MTTDDRKVALKVLKPELATVLGADRFVVEIKTTASLSHPPLPFNVDIDGKRFLMTRPAGGANEAPDQLVVVENFVEELRARLPR